MRHKWSDGLIFDLLRPMKRIIVLISLALLLISACLVYLAKEGISLRAATLIKPSIMKPPGDELAQAVVLRMFPEFNDSHILLWGLHAQFPPEKMIFDKIKEEYERVFKLKVNLLDNAENSTEEERQNCAKPCWWIVTPDKANELSRNSVVEKQLRPLARPYTNLTLIPFKKSTEVSDECLKEKRLSLECLKQVSIKEANRKIKTDEPHFFLKKYNTKDFFLFVQVTEN